MSQIVGYTDQDEFRVTIQLDVTADGPHQALEYALDDLRDMSIDGMWQAFVYNLITDVLYDVTQGVEARARE